MTRRVEPPSTPGLSGLLGLGVGVVIVAALAMAREVLIPITLAVLLSFLLGPVVGVQRRIGVPRVIAVFVTVLVAIGIVALLGAIIGSQLAALAGDVPQYATTIEHKVSVARNFISDQLSAVTNRLVTLQQAPPAAPSSRGEPAPVPVIVHQPAPSPLDLAWSLALPVVSPLATIGIVFVVAVFILLQREDLRDRIIRLFGSDDLHRTTAALNDAGRRLGRYYLSLVAVNTCFGLIIGTGLFFIGIPGPILWGILAGLLRFVPYVGAFAGAALPILLGAAIDPSWSKVAEVVALFLAVEPVLGQVIEPLIYGRSTGLSPFSVVIAAIFWGWIWGGIGLLLSMPLTLCLVVLGRHIERLQFLDVLLGDRPPLSPAESLYQRMLAGDARSVIALAEASMKTQPFLAFADEVVLPALRLAAVDSLRGSLTEAQAQRIAELVSDVIDEITDEAAPAAHAGPAGRVVCIARSGPLDEAACALLGHALQERGIALQTLGSGQVSRAAIGQLDLQRAERIVLSAIEGVESRALLRGLLRRLRARAEAAQIIVALWAADTEREHMPGGAGPDKYVTSLQQVVAGCGVETGSEPVAEGAAAGSVAESP